MMMIRLCSVSILLAAAVSFSVKVVAADLQPVPAGGNELLLELIKKAIAEDPSFQKDLEQLVGKKQRQDVQTLRELVSAQTVVIKELRAELEGSKNPKDGEKETQPDKGPEWIIGTVVVDNKCPHFVNVRINGQLKLIGPGRFSFPVWVRKKEGKALVELTGFEQAREWSLTSPDYKATVTIAPSSKIVLPDRDGRRMTVFKPMLAP